MIRVRKAEDRGRTVLDWLDSRHTFSFGEYRDPGHTAFGALRVINEDRVAPGGGFGTHPHRDMEILTYVLEGALEHRDSLGTGSVIRPGEIQRMTAGTGILHSEMNASPAEPVHFVQIWILPERRGLTPGYEQRAFGTDATRGGLLRLASREGMGGAVTVHQDLELYAALLDPDRSATRALRPGRRAWLQVARGRLDLNGVPLGPGDGAGIENETRLELRARDEAEILLFDLV